MTITSKHIAVGFLKSI